LTTVYSPIYGSHVTKTDMENKKKMFSVVETASMFDWIYGDSTVDAKFAC
jgi:hypothetical protein